MVTNDMVLVPKAFIEFVKNAPVSSGVCCCGNSIIEGVGCGDHSPVDQWDYSLDNWLKEILVEPPSTTGD